MTDTIANALVDLARLCLYAYAIKHGRDVIIHWLDVTPKLTPAQIVDAARAHGWEMPQVPKVAA